MNEEPAFLNKLSVISSNWSWLID